MGYFATGLEISEIIGCSPSHVSQMKNRGQIPKQFLKMEKDRVSGKMRERIHTDFGDWYRENKITRKPGPTPGLHISDISAKKQEAELAKLILQAQKIKMDIDEKNKLLISVDDHEKILSTRATVFKTDLYAIADTNANKIVDIAAGDQAKIPDVSKYLRDLFNKMMLRYVKG